MLRQVCVKGNVSFIFEEDFVDHKVNKPKRKLYSTDLVHLNMKGLSLWLRKVRAFLGLVTLLKRPGRQSAEEHSHYNPTAFRVFKNAENAEPRNVQRRRPTLSSIPVVTGNRVGERFLPGDRSGPTHSPGSRERETTTAQMTQCHSLILRGLFHLTVPVRGQILSPTGILDPSKDRLKERIKSLNNTVPPPTPPLPGFCFCFCFWWVTKLPLAFCNIRI